MSPDLAWIVDVAIVLACLIELAVLAWFDQALAVWTDRALPVASSRSDDRWSYDRAVADGDDQWRKLRTPSADLDIERLRIRARRRLAVAILCAPTVVVLPAFVGLVGIVGRRAGAADTPALTAVAVAVSALALAGAAAGRQVVRYGSLAPLSRATLGGAAVTAVGAFGLLILELTLL